MHPVKVNTLRHNVVANENKCNSNNIYFSLYVCGSPLLRGLSMFWLGDFPKEDLKGPSAHWASYLPFGYQISFYYVPIGCGFIAINPERPIMRLRPG